MITEAIVQALPNNMVRVYECVAVGSPLPDITWSALNSNTDSRQQLENNIPGITVDNEMNAMERHGELTIAFSAPFEEPMCALKMILAE